VRPRRKTFCKPQRDAPAAAALAASEPGMAVPPVLPPLGVVVVVDEPLLVVSLASRRLQADSEVTAANARTTAMVMRDCFMGSPWVLGSLQPADGMPAALAGPGLVAAVEHRRLNAPNAPPVELGQPHI
jgi:hypothetical protein